MLQGTSFFCEQLKLTSLVLQTLPKALPIQTALRVADASVQDGLRNQTVQDFAQLGGPKMRNNERDYHRFMKDAYGNFLETYPVRLTVRGSTGLPQVVDFPTLAPHEVAASAYAAGGAAWDETILGSRGGDKLIQFWRHIRQLPWNPLEEGDRPEECFPITLHGDCAPCYNGDSVLIVSWSCPLAAGGSLGHKMLIAVISKERLVSNTSLNELMSFIAWSINCMIEGRWPLQGHNGPLPPGKRRSFQGKPLAGPWKGRWFAMKGDLEYFRWALKWRRHYNCCKICVFCDACKAGDMLYTNIHEGAPWERTERTHEEIELSGDVQTPLSAIKGWDHKRVLFDLMHVMHLGLLKDVLGAAIVLLCEHPYFYGQQNLEKNLDAAYGSWRSWCQHNHITTSVRRFTPSRLHRLAASDFPCLSVKASNAKRVLWWLQEECILAAESQDQLICAMATCITQLCSFLSCLDEADLILTETEAANAYEYGQNFLLSLNLIFNRSRDRYLLRPRPKVHYYRHLLMGLKEDRINVRHLACYQEEDMMGKTTRVAKRTHRTTTSLCTLLRCALHVCCPLLWTWRAAMDQQRAPPLSC